MARKWVYLFTEGNANMRELLGGKGANLAEMTNIGLPVPQGFTITTEACTQYYEDGRRVSLEIQGQIYEYVEKLATGKDETAKKFLFSGLLVFYLRLNDYEQAQVDKLERLIRRNESEDMAAITTICFALQGKKAIDLFGNSVGTLDELIPILGKCKISEIDELLRDVLAHS